MINSVSVFSMTHSLLIYWHGYKLKDSKAYDVKGEKTVITKDKGFEVGKIGFGNQAKRYSKTLRASDKQQDRDSKRVAIEYETKAGRTLRRRQRSPRRAEQSKYLCSTRLNVSAQVER
jgi:hypothetical protein